MSTILSTISPGLAESFSPDKTYHTGNIVLYRNKYWVCNTHETEGSWRESDWTEYPEFVKLLEDKLSKKRDVADMFTAWEIKGSSEAFIYPVWDDFRHRWELQIATTTYYSSSGFNATEATFTASTGETIQAIRKRILTEDDVTDDLENPTAGKAADAKTVGEALGAATKLTPVFSEWVPTFKVNEAAKNALLEYYPDDFTESSEFKPSVSGYDIYVDDVSIGATDEYAEYATTAKLSGGHAVFFGALGIQPDDTVAIRSIVGYKLGDKTTPTLMATDGPKYDSATGTVKIFIEE